MVALVNRTVEVGNASTANVVALDGHEDAGTYTLRRTGRRPIRFRGWQLIEAVGYTGGFRFWHELNVFQTVAGALVLELVVRRPALSERDLNRVEVLPDLEAVAAWLEGYPAEGDVPTSLNLGADNGGLADSAVQALAWRQLQSRVGRDYRALVADVLYSLEVAEESGTPAKSATPAAKLDAPLGLAWQSGGDEE